MLDNRLVALSAEYQHMWLIHSVGSLVPLRCRMHSIDRLVCLIVFSHLSLINECIDTSGSAVCIFYSFSFRSKDIKRRFQTVRLYGVIEWIRWLNSSHRFRIWNSIFFPFHTQLSFSILLWKLNFDFGCLMIKANLKCTFFSHWWEEEKTYRSWKLVCKRIWKLNSWLLNALLNVYLLMRQANRIKYMRCHF